MAYFCMYMLYFYQNLLYAKCVIEAKMVSLFLLLKQVKEWMLIASFHLVSTAAMMGEADY